MVANSYKTLILIGLIVLSLCVSGQQPAFPDAEGYGKYTIGGRGGKVYEVTNLNDSGTGSLRSAVEAYGPRTVVFRISGTITLTKNLKISNPYITIAGQTAPGDGICIKKFTLDISTDEVIIRYIRLRYGDEVQADADAVSMRYHKNIILDHVSASWGDDETLSLYHGENVTVQWCIIAETLNRGGSHGFAGIWGSPRSTFHHNLVANCVSRNMRFASGCGNTDYRNNVIYNWGYNSAYGGENQQVGNADFYFSSINMVANYYKPGPATVPKVNHRIVNPSYRDVKTDYGKYYVSDNYVFGNTAVTADNWNGGVDPQGGSGDISLVKLAEPWPSMAINQQHAENACSSVLDNAGASLPKRDAADRRIVQDTRDGDATYEGTTYEPAQVLVDETKMCGIIESQNQAGGWPVLVSAPAPVDTDHDGMPDEWEITHQLDPNNKDDGNIVGNDGYTHLEKYLNAIEFFNPVSDYRLTKLSDTSYKLEWGDNYLTEDSFRVERSIQNGNFEVIAALPKYSNHFTDTSVLPGPVTYRVVAFNKDNATPSKSGISTAETSVGDLISAPGELKVNCFPNPFTDKLNFVIAVAKAQKVRIELFDINQKKIVTITDSTLQAGNHSIFWDSKDSGYQLKTGVYIVSVTLKESGIKKGVRIIKV